MRIEPAARRDGSLRHAQLLGVLICFHLAGPMVQAVAPTLAVLILFPLYVLVLGAATLAMSSRRSRALLGVLALPMLICAAISLLAEQPTALLLSASTLPFLCYAAYAVFRSVLEPGVVDRDRLLGSACVFILLAQTWAGAYALLEWLSPGSIVTSGQPQVRVGDLTYLSFVTQTTLGYGDITPLSPVARSMATLQATAGLFYMGVIVARFAGRLHFGSAMPPEHAATGSPRTPTGSSQPATAETEERKNS